MPIEIQKRDQKIIQFAYTFRVVTYGQIRQKFFLNCHESAARNRIRQLCKGGFLRSVGIESNSLLLKCVSPTEKSWPLIEKLWDFDIERPYFRSESVEHDFRLAEVASRFSKLSLYKSLVTENLLQSSDYFANHAQFCDLVNIQSDAILSLQDSEGTEFLYAVELEISRKSPERYRQKLSSYYRAGGIDGVIYICGSQDILDLIARTDKDVCTNQSSVVYMGSEQSVLESDGEMIFKAPDGKGIRLF